MSNITEQPPPPPSPSVPTVKPVVPSRWKTQVVTVLLSSLVGAVVCGGLLIAVHILVGLPSFAGDGSFTQRGELNATPEGVDVYYPIPYKTQPNLKVGFGGADSGCEIVEQRANGFRVKSRYNHTVQNVRWEARGIKGGS
jgi:hypothetical protein